MRLRESEREREKGDVRTDCRFLITDGEKRTSPRRRRKQRESNRGNRE
jgi:hypothetical protein